MDVKIRKTEINLITIGTGVIVLAAWTLVKFLITYFFIGLNLGDDSSSNNIVTYVLIWSFSIISFLLNGYVGFSARALGNGKNKHSFFIFVAGLIVFFRIVVVIIELIAAFISLGDFIDLIISAFIDITTIVFLVELIVNSIRLKKMRKADLAKEADYEL